MTAKRSVRRIRRFDGIAPLDRYSIQPDWPQREVVDLGARCFRALAVFDHLLAMRRQILSFPLCGYSRRSCPDKVPWGSFPHRHGVSTAMRIADRLLQSAFAII